MILCIAYDKTGECIPYICLITLVLSELRSRLAPFNRFMPSYRIFLLTVPRGVLLLWFIHVVSVVGLFCFCARLFIVAL